MKIAICDDIKKERDLIQNYCLGLGYTDIALFSCGEDLLSDPDLSSIQLLFLDIQMSTVSGIEVKNQLELSSPSTYIVFTTTHHELVNDAFGRNVISFLSKPFSEKSIFHCIHKARNLSKNFYPIVINEDLSVPCQNVCYLHAENKYTVFYTTDGNSHLSRISLTTWGNKLKDLGFFPISRNAIINLKYYKNITQKYVVLKDNTKLSVSRRCLPLLKDSFHSYMLHQI